MIKETAFDVIVIGGSYSGLSAAMALGRAARKVLIMDSGSPCNKQTPYSHNFLTQDGKPPAEIAAFARQQVRAYPTITFYEGIAASGAPGGSGFEIVAGSGERFTAAKLLFATGIKDLMPAISGFAECWGISILHCPYCHGYEVRNEKTAVLGNGEYAFDFSKLISNWTNDLTLLTNGPSGLTAGQLAKIKACGVDLLEQEVSVIEESNGQVERVVFKDGSAISLRAIYTRLPFVQQTDIPASLGCEITADGYIKVDAFQRTTIPGVFACGDNSASFRALSTAVAAGSMAGAMVNKEIIEEEFG